MKKRVLFLCVHNSARSQMAEAILKARGGDRFEAHSAGLEPGTLNPFAVQAMQEWGIDISGKKTQSVFDVSADGTSFSHVVTVCHESEAQGCPIFPGPTRRLHWPFPDPSQAKGTPEEKLAEFRRVRDSIRERVEEFLAAEGE